MFVISGSLPLTLRRLEALEKGSDSEALVAALYTELGWAMLLESDFSRRRFPIVRVD